MSLEVSAHALAAFSLGLPAYILIKVLVPGFYARQDTRTPVRRSAVSLGGRAATRAARSTMFSVPVTA